ncbi:uncharacterized protein LOC110185399 isoform X4 [Drosophila serrata]|uniref:uncharacterized protein LOC110185399 isoform X4 n=1 Tax=Drosophila serrata TaxID=7274 RepID=UPI000A1D1B11|nr:uncharacterized protein LOC110185399 isoform X4 [Drosophila serrata]
MDSTPVVNIENGNSAEKELKNDEVTITVVLAPNQESGGEAESQAVESEQNQSLDITESTENQVEQISSITVASTDANEKDTKEAVTDSDSVITVASTDTIDKDIKEDVTDSDSKPSDPTIKEPSITDNPPLNVDNVLKIEDDKPKIPIDDEKQDVIVEESESGDDGVESFSEDEDPNDRAKVSSELTAENNNKIDLTTANESLNEKEKKDPEGNGEEGLSIDKLKKEDVESELLIKKPTETEVSKQEEHIPVQSDFSNAQTIGSEVKSSDQKDFNNQIKEIISDIDINIKAQEKITQLKEQELKLIQKQNELASQIHQQQLLAQQLSDQNRAKQQPNQWKAKSKSEIESQRFHHSDPPFQPITTQSQEPANISKTNIDLRKIFTPATDTPEILPKNRKLYASSAFYSPTLHPTVEDQVELARRISHSLSDISNQTSKGQSMYVNRKKRSVKWVHEGGQDYQQYQPRPKAISPNIVPAYSDAGKHRVQLNLHQNQLIEKYSKGGVQVVKSPWEAALQTGSASSAFLEESPDQGRCPTVSSPTMYHRQSASRDLTDAAVKPSHDLGLKNNQQHHREELCRNKSPAPTPFNPQRVLAYTPSVAQGWGGRNVELPKGLYVPKEISLSSYVPPPQKQLSFAASQTNESTFRPLPKSNFGTSPDTQSSNGRFPLPNSNPLGYTTSVPKQQHSFSPQPINNIAPQVNFNPSPLSFEKLSRYENLPDNHSQQQHLNIRQKTQVQNASPIPFGTPKCTSFNENLSRSPISWNSPIGGTSPQPHQLSYVPCQKQSHQGQSFNKLAKGWGEVQSKQHQQTYSSPFIPPATLSRNLPYTEVPYSDF